MQVNYWIVPTDINFIPADASRKRLDDYMSKPEQLFDLGFENMHGRVFPRLTYIDGYDGFYPMRFIGCPACHANIPTEGSWACELHDKLVDDAGLNVEQHRVITPCCGSDVSLLQLDFKGQGGFTRFAVELIEVDYEGSDENLLAEPQKILGCGLRKIEIWYT